MASRPVLRRCGVLLARRWCFRAGEGLGQRRCGGAVVGQALVAAAGVAKVNGARQVCGVEGAHLDLFCALAFGVLKERLVWFEGGRVGWEVRKCVV